MSTDDRYDYLPESVQRRIASGEVPPPRAGTDPLDPIRDLRLAIAIAEDGGDTATVARLNAQWIAHQRANPESATWEAPAKRYGPLAASLSHAGPVTRDVLLAAAHEADQAGDDDRAHAYRVQAMHAPDSDAVGVLNQAAEADDPDRAAYLQAEALQALRGETPPPADPTEPSPPPTTVPEINAAIAEADAAGDKRTADQHRLRLLALARQRAEAPVYAFDAPAPTDD